MIIGIIGLGTVGLGVIDIIAVERTRLEKEIGEAIVVKKACARTPKELATKETMFTTHWEDIVSDPEIDTVVELIGGTTIAKEIVMRTIAEKKNIVTANKALIAHDAEEIFSAAEANGVNVYFEASVGGGIPIITTLKESLIANNVCEIQGIINGTTNFILSKMETEGYEYSEIYQIASDLGYLEADPTLDIEGIDAAHKLAILTMLSYQKYLPFEQIKTKGISTVTKQDIFIADQWDYRIKLLANAQLENGKVALDVYPTLLPKSDLFAGVMDAFNAVKIIGDRTGDIILYGKGAGRYPTASAVVADIMKMSHRDHWNFDFSKAQEILPITKSKYYVRINDGSFNFDTLALALEETYQSNTVSAFITEEIEKEVLKEKLCGKQFCMMKVK